MGGAKLTPGPGWFAEFQFELKRMFPTLVASKALSVVGFEVSVTQTMPFELPLAETTGEPLLVAHWSPDCITGPERVPFDRLY